jgi:hypothetical protein
MPVPMTAPTPSMTSCPGPRTRGKVGPWFLTKEFTIDRGHGAETLLAVYVPTNHLYLGDVIIASPDKVLYPEISVEQGLRIFLTGGMALPGRLRIESQRAEGRRR